MKTATKLAVGAAVLIPAIWLGSKLFGKGKGWGVIEIQRLTTPSGDLDGATVSADGLILWALLYNKTAETKTPTVTFDLTGPQGVVSFSRQITIAGQGGAWTSYAPFLDTPEFEVQPGAYQLKVTADGATAKASFTVVQLATATAIGQAREGSGLNIF